MASIVASAVAGSGTATLAFISTLSEGSLAALNAVTLYLTGLYAAVTTLDRVLLQQYRTVLIFFAVTLVTLVTGPFLRSETGFFMTAGDVLWSCVGDPLYQAFNKLFLFHSAVANNNALPATNNFLVFGIARGGLAYTAVVDVLDCFLGLSRQNFEVLFALPLKLGLFFAALPFGVVSAPRQIRIEPVTPGEWGYHYPLENFQPLSVRRFEFNLEYQAQGPAQNPADGYPNPAYSLRDQWITGSRIWEQLYELVFGVFADLPYPTSRLLPSFYIDTAQQRSIWRKIADLISTTLEWLFLTSIWPYEPIGSPPYLGIQPIRDKTLPYIVGTLRGAGKALRFLSLVINDVLTMFRPMPRDPNVCEPLPDGVAANIERFLRGFPIIDFFLPRDDFFTNLNIFRSNLVFCQFMVAIRAEDCDGLAKGSLAFNPGPPLELCPEWNGADIPLPEERINYVGELVEVVFDLVDTFINQPPEPSLSLKLEETADVVTLWLNLIIDSLLFVVNAIADPIGCALGSSIEEWFGVRFPAVAIATIELAFSDSCALAIVEVDSRDNIFLCVVALSSRAAPDSFWGDLCSLIDGLDFVSGSLSLNCLRAKRKRDLGQVRVEPRPLTWSQWYGLYAPYYAYETRSALHAFDYCFTNANTSHMLPPVCKSACSARVCVDGALDCVQKQLLAANDTKNGWIERLQPDSYWRTAARATMMASDTWFGCVDGDSEMIYRAINSTVSVLRDLSARTSAASVVFGTAHARCTEQADWSNSTVYLHCIGLEPLAETWEETLELNNITKSTLCGALLHEHGIELQSTDSVYTGCLTMLAYGSMARATHAIAKDVALAEFLSGWTVASAVSRSTEQIETVESWNLHPRNTSWWGALMIDGPVGPAPEKSQARIDALASDKVVRSVHDASSLMYAYFNYLADTYQHIITQPIAGPEKDLMAKALFRDRVASVGIAVAKQAAPVRQSRLEFNQKVVANDYKARTQAGTMEIARFYGQSLMWVDRLYFDIVNSASQVVVQRSGFDDVVGAGVLEEQLAIGDGSLVEMRIEPQLYSGGALVLPPKLAMRAPRHWSSTVVLADYYHAHRKGIVKSPATGPEGDFSRVNLIDIVVALESFCTNGTAKRDARDIADARQSAAVLRKLDSQVVAANIGSKSIEKVLGEGAVVAGRIGLRLLWSLVSRTLRLESMSSVQAAAVVIDVITNGDRVGTDGENNLKQWLAGERGYIIGVGYVERHAYDYYMEQESLTRRVLTNGIFSPLLPEERNLVGFATVARRRMLERSAMTRKQFRAARDGVVFALPGKTPWGLFVERQRNRLRRRITFLHRTRFLHEHGIEDEHLHIVAPTTWTHYEAALNASVSGNTTERRVLSELVVATAGDNEFLYSLWDETLAAVFGIDRPVGATRDQLYDTIEENAANFFSDLSSSIQQFFDETIVAATCPSEQAYRLGGTLPYRLGCLPFLPERLFAWYTEYPSDLPSTPYPYDGIFATFVGPGYLLWPADMIKTPCANPRVPSVNGQCPAQNQSISLFSAPFQFLADACIHNACPGTSIPAEKPGCLLGTPGPNGGFLRGCDYCEQTYFSAEEKDFTSGWINISVWSSAWRALVRNSVTAVAVRGFWFIVVLFILTEFVSLLPGTGSLVTSLIIFIALFADIYITQTPERYAFFYLFLFAVRAYGRGAAWIIWLVYVVNLYPMVALGSLTPLFADFLQSAAYYTSPDVLLFYFFGFVRDYVAWSVQWLIDLRAAIDIINGQLSQRFLVASPTVSEFLYATFSYFSVIETAALFTPYVAAVALVLFTAAVAAVIVFKFIGGLFAACLCCYGLYLSIRMCLLRRKVKDQEEEIDSLRADVDALMEFRKRQ
jgi:hypothetical protein